MFKQTALALSIFAASLPAFAASQSNSLSEIAQINRQEAQQPYDVWQSYLSAAAQATATSKLDQALAGRYSRKARDEADQAAYLADRYTRKAQDEADQAAYLSERAQEASAAYQSRLHDCP